MQFLYAKSGERVALNPKNDKILKSVQKCRQFYSIFIFEA